MLKRTVLALGVLALFASQAGTQGLEQVEGQRPSLRRRAARVGGSSRLLKGPQAAAAGPQTPDKLVFLPALNEEGRRARAFSFQVPGVPYAGTILETKVQEGERWKVLGVQWDKKFYVEAGKGGEISYGGTGCQKGIQYALTPGLYQIQRLEGDTPKPVRARVFQVQRTYEFCQFAPVDLANWSGIDREGAGFDVRAYPDPPPQQAPVSLLLCGGFNLPLCDGRPDPAGSRVAKVYFDAKGNKIDQWGSRAWYETYHLVRAPGEAEERWALSSMVWQKPGPVGPSSFIGARALEGSAIWAGEEGKYRLTGGVYYIGDPRYGFAPAIVLLHGGQFIDFDRSVPFDLLRQLGLNPQWPAQ